MLLGLLVVAGLEIVEAQRKLRHAVLLLNGSKLARELEGARPVGTARLELERLFKQKLVVGIMLERGAIERCGIVGVVLGPGKAAREIAADERVGGVERVRGIHHLAPRGPGNAHEACSEERYQGGEPTTA